MDRFYGLWRVQLDKSVGFTEIARLFGWSEEKLKMMSTLDYTLLLETSPGDKGRCLVDYGVLKTEFLFKLGEPFDFLGADGTQAKCTVNLEDGVLIENYISGEGIKWRTERVLDGTNMKAITSFEISDVKCIQELVKV
ncbi:hypothetical protein BsWGS_08864 [Bradybaena similaris]